jgi:hypothetical protein
MTHQGLGESKTPSQFPAALSMPGFDFTDTRGFDEPQCFLADSLKSGLCMRVKSNRVSWGNFGVIARRRSAGKIFYRSTHMEGPHEIDAEACNCIP